MKAQLPGRVAPRPVLPPWAIGIRFGLALVLTLAANLVPSGAAGAATTAPTFARADYTLFGNNYAVGDFNRDGSLDLAGVGAAARIRLNNGAGGFGETVDYAIGGQGQDIAAGDVNGDGSLDLLVTLNNQQVGLSLLTGNGDGTFDPPVSFPNTSGAGSPAVAAVDLNNDTRLDVVIAHDIACFTAPCVNSELLSVLIGNGDGTFQASRDIPVGKGMAEIAVGDYNRDGFKDLAIGGTQGQVYRLDGVGDGTFVQRPTLIAVVDPSFIPVTDVDVGDFNGDSILDLVAAVPHNGSRTAILVGNGDGTFRTPLVLTDPGLRIPQQQAVADYNGDGFQDLALSLGEGDQGVMQIRSGNGDGTFQAPVQYLVPPPTSSVGGIFIVSANLNGDSKPDIGLNIGGAFPSFAVLLNSTGAVAPTTPAAPTLLSPGQDARPVQPISFDWTDVAAATSYRIQVDDSSSFSAPLVIDRVVQPSQFVSSTPLNVGQRYWWRVRAINSAGTAGPWSSARRFTAGTFAQATSLAGIALSPSSVVGGSASQGTVTLTSAAPSGGLAVALSSSNPAVATVPANVSVAQGATSASFTVGTSVVTTSTAVTITASAGGVTRTAILTVNPSAQTATLTVTATGRGGERVTSTPTGINVSVGSTGSASFAVGTTIRLSASNERDVIWSGACSSGGSKTKTCTFTFNGNATVTANVQ